MAYICFRIRSMKLLVIVLFAILFLPCIMLFNNLFFYVDYSDMPQLDDDFIGDWLEDDPRLIAHIRKHYVYPPAPHSAPYNLLFPDKEDWSHKAQSKVVDGILGSQRNGVFFEAGAYDGETYSNSLYFEKYLNWTGVMVEPDWANVKRFLEKGRKSYLVRGCIEGSKKTPQKMELMGAMETGSLSQHTTLSRQVLTAFWRPVKFTTVWCWPLYSVLLAVNMTKINYMTLDIEGAENPIMRSAPWDKIDVDVFQIEYAIFAGAYLDKDRSSIRRRELGDIMKMKFPDYEERASLVLDMIYAKKSLRNSHSKENGLRKPDDTLKIKKKDRSKHQTYSGSHEKPRKPRILKSKDLF